MCGAAPDGTWASAPGPVTSDSVYDGEAYDARLAPAFSVRRYDHTMRCTVVHGASGLPSYTAAIAGDGVPHRGF